MKQLKDKTSKGINRKMRAIIWRRLFGYVPITSNKKSEILNNKRKDYI